MNSMTVLFQKQDEGYTRTVTFPDGTCVTERDVWIKKNWYAPEQWPWIKRLHEYSRQELGQGLFDPTRALSMARAIRDGVKDVEALKKSLAQATDRWATLSLAAVEDNRIHLDPLLVFQLLDNEESRFRQTKENIETLREAMGAFFLLLDKQTEERPQRPFLL